MFSLLGKVLVAFIVILIPLFVIDFAFFATSERELRNEIFGSVRSKVTFFADQFSSELERIQSQQRRIANDDDVVFLSVAGGIMPVYDRIVAIRSLEGRLFDIKNSSAYIDDVFVYVPLVGYRLSSSYHVTSIDPAEYTAMRKAADTGTIFPWKGHLFTSMAYPNGTIQGVSSSLVVAVQYSSAQFNDVLKRLVVNMGATPRGEVGSAALFGPEYAWYIGTASKQGVETAMREYALTPQESGPGAPVRVRTSRSPSMIYAFHSALFDFSLVFLVPESLVLEPVRMFGWWMALLIAASVVVISVFSLWLHRLVDRPLKRLVAGFRRLESGDFDQTIDYARRDEFGYLYGRFNKTTSRLKALVHEVYEQKYRLSVAELGQLQSQVKPHFLYNCFFTLQRMAKQEAMTKVERFSEALGRYYRYITAGGENDVDLDSEFRHAAAYVDIQTVRFDDRISVRIDELPESIRQLRVPRLILQPIIENAYEHGLDDHLSGGRIDVRVTMDYGILAMTVTDNGKGMSDIRLDEVRHRLAAPFADVEHHGLYNVHRRIQIRYGSQYGIAIRKAECGGLEVTARIPAEDIRVSPSGS